MKSAIYDEIVLITQKYEKNRKRSRFLGIIFATLFVIVGGYIIFKYIDKEITLSVGSLGGVLGALVGMLFRQGAKLENNPMEEIKSLIESNGDFTSDSTED